MTRSILLRRSARPTTRISRAVVSNSTPNAPRRPRPMSAATSGPTSRRTSAAGSGRRMRQRIELRIAVTSVSASSAPVLAHLVLAPADRRGELSGVVEGQRQQVGADPDEVPDDAPRVEVGVGLVGCVHRAEVVERLEHRLRERHQRAEHVLLVERQARGDAPRRQGLRGLRLAHLGIVEDEVAHGSVHQPHSTNVVVAGARAGHQSVARHRVDEHLGRLVHPPNGVGDEAGGQREHPGATRPGVRLGQRRGRTTPCR